MKGRPQKEIKKDELRKLTEIRCSLSEIAYYYECSEDTIERRCKKFFDCTFAEFRTQTKEGAKIAIRKTLFKRALDGSDKILLKLAESFGMFDNEGNSTPQFNSGLDMTRVETKPRITDEMTVQTASLIYKDLIKQTRMETA